MTDEKKKALDDAFAQIEKHYGKGSVMRLGERTAMNVESVSTGSMALDLALGIGGLPKGRIVEIFGPESSGKTTVALHSIAEVQRQGGEAAFIDAEHALDPVYARKLGVDVDKLIVSQPDTGEQALEIAEKLVCSGAIDVIVIDSVAALVPKAEIDGVMGDSHVGLHARLMSQALRKLAGYINKSNTIAIFINQLREKIGGYSPRPGQPAVTTTGGRALKFYASVRLEVKKGDWIKKGEEVIGVQTKVKVVKNKVAPPFRSATFDIMYGKGIVREGDVLDVAVAIGVITKSGSWFSYGDKRLGQGKDRVKAMFVEDPAFFAEVEQKVREALKRGEIVAPIGEELDGASETADKSVMGQVTMEVREELPV